MGGKSASVLQMSFTQCCFLILFKFHLTKYQEGNFVTVSQSHVDFTLFMCQIQHRATVGKLNTHL